MKKFLAALKHGAIRLWPLAIAGGSAIVVSPGFQHFIENHPSDAVFVPVVVWLLHAAGAAKTKPLT